MNITAEDTLEGNFFFDVGLVNKFDLFLIFETAIRFFNRRQQ